MTKNKEILTIIIGFLTGAGLIVYSFFAPELRGWLLPIALIFIGTPIGIEIGINSIPHNKQQIKSMKLDNFKKEQEILLSEPEEEEEEQAAAIEEAASDFFTTLKNKISESKDLEQKKIFSTSAPTAEHSQNSSEETVQ